jgi:signal transduction histidine kinase
MRKTITGAGLATAHVVIGLPVAALSTALVGTTSLYVMLGWAHRVGRPVGQHGRRMFLSALRFSNLLQRQRFDALLGEPLDPAAGERGRPMWRALSYHAGLALLVSLLTFTLLVSLWITALFLFLLPLLSPGGSNLFGLSLGDPVALAGLLLLGLALCAAAVLAAPKAARLELRVARSMLAVRREDELAQRVEALTESRAEVVDAADAERRRIERDLHDGAQQRLVALAMNLGMARAELTETDAAAKRVIADAHDEAKQALTELRQLIRGLHPAVLDHRGLDAALTGITARSPVPATLSVDVKQRPSPTIEAIAYFVVSEALSNVAKHAQAKAVDVTVKREDSVLRVTIRDNGKGGANPSSGTGLRGLQQRVSSVDGTLSVLSPAGGPTLITVELPCES